MPNTTTSRQLQKQYRTLFDEVMSKKEPLVVLNKNNPEVVIIDIQTFEILMKNNAEYEQMLAQKSLQIYQQEKKKKKLKKLGSLADLA